MNITEIKILVTGITFIVFFLSRFSFNKLVDSTVTKSLLQKTRGKIIKKIIQLILATITFVIILTVWGVDKSELFTMVASVLTVIGIALFAQWSHLSNITSGIIIFFYHTVKLDDSISILDKEYDIEGRISDIGLFFIILKTKQGEEISFPNNIFLQKMIKKSTI